MVLHFFSSPRAERYASPSARPPRVSRRGAGDGWAFLLVIEDYAGFAVIPNV